MTTPPAPGAPPTSLVRRLVAPLAGFPRPFWTINGLELFERGAFYSVMAVLSAYLSINLGLTPSQIGLVFTLLFPLLYFVPLVAAALAEKFGYKQGLVVSFAILSAGYAAVAFANDFRSMLVAIVLVGVGAGAFKPIAAALVAQSTSEAQRNFAFVIYYAGINLGAFLFPLSVGLVGIVAPALLNITAFVVATLLIVANLVLTITIFNNLRPPQRDVRVLQALARLGGVFKDPAFLVLLVIYSGFWFMYAMNQTFLPLYMVDFARMPIWFNVALMATINPLVIIIAAPFLGRLTEGRDSLGLMIAGISLFVVGFVVVGFSAGPALFVLGIVLFSMGEVLTQPSFLSYVSKIAPADRVAVYLGYGFIPIGVGLTLGSMFGGVFYETFATNLRNPALFWAVMCGVVLATLSALILYNHVMSRRRAVAAGGGVAAARPGLARLLTGPAAAVVAVLLIPALIFGGVFTGASIAPPASPGLGASSLDLAVLNLAAIPGDSAEGETTETTIDLPANATGVATFTLKWTDEAAPTGAVNAPDSLKLHVTLPNGTMIASEAIANPQGGEGVITLKVPAVPGAYTVGVEAVDCGDTTMNVGPLALPVGGTADTTNAWTLDVAHEATKA